MKAKRPNGFGKAIERFFREYLPTLRGMSLHTIHSYRDAVVLFLRFVSSRSKKRVENLDLSDVTAERVRQFLTYLEVERHNGVSTRNARLAALHTFARFLAAEQPAHLAELQRILAVPFKRGARNGPIEYLERKEADALLGNIDRSTRLGQRDYALFALMLNTGARVQEILDLRLSDVRTQPPHQVRLRGKGGKTRLCPIWPQTAALLRELVERAHGDNASDAWLFANRRGAKLTRFGSLRHTTAIYLLKAGVDFATISQWLGHSTLNTTMTYTRADLDLKRQALRQVFPETLGTPQAGRLSLAAVDVIDWLKRL